MRRAAAGLELGVRPYGPADEADVLELLGRALGGGPAGSRPPEFLRWKHMENPFGPSLMLVGEADGRIIGLRAFMRWRFQSADRTLAAVRAVDTATHPDYRGMGVFSLLTREALKRLRHDTDLVFNTPNQESLPGYLKMGWQVVGKVPVGVRILHPIRFARGVRSVAGAAGTSRPRPTVEAEPASEALCDATSVGELLRESDAPGPRLSTPRDVAYLRWRFAEAPLLDYRAVREERAGTPRGLAIFRVRPRGRLWESTVAEILAPENDPGVVRRLLHGVIKSAAVDHLTVHLPHPRARVVPRLGLLRSPVGPTLVVNPLMKGLTPDPMAMRSWGLSVGDLEIF